MYQADPATPKDKDYAALCATITGLRDEAIRARQDSGIEQIWTEDREHYDGIDDANRGEKLLKPATSDGRPTKERKKKNTRSTVFLNITARYVNSAAAYVCDKLFRSDVSNYGLRPTPKPDLVNAMDDTSPAIGPDGQAIVKPVLDGNGEQQMQPHMVNGQPMMDEATGQPVMIPAMAQATKGDLAKQIMEKAKTAAEKAKTQIDDWLNECGINGQSRQVVVDAAMLGTGVLKGPFPEMSKSSAVLQQDGMTQLVIEEKLVPKSRRISAWNLYPDPSCGTDIHRGKYIFEEDEINARLLGDLKKDPSYLADAIDKVLEEGPTHALTGTSKRNRSQKKHDREIFQIWYFHGYISAEDLEACGYEFGDEAAQEEQEEPGLLDSMPLGEGEVVEGGEYMGETLGQADLDSVASDAVAVECECQPDRKEQYPCIVVMVNNTIIKATISPFDSGRFPYNIMRWQYRDDHWAGLGVARQMRTSQEGVNAGVRMLHDNAGVSGAPVLIFDRKKIVPADGNWTIGPHKVYYTTDEYDGVNIRDAITWILTPSMQVEMMNIIQFWMKMAEEETGMPMLLQGQSGNIEHTYGEAQILNNNGSAMLRRVTNIYDDDVTKPHVSGYYEWLLIHHEDDSLKGDFKIDALASSVLIERDAHSQLLMQMLGLSLNPAYEADPSLVFKEFLLSQRFDAEKLAMSEEKKKEMASRQPPPPPQLLAAQVREEGANQRKQMEIQAEAQQAEMDRALEQWKKNIDAHLESARLGGDQSMNADNLKVSLARETMKLRAQINLAMNGGRAPQVAAPAMEPPGRAPNGMAFPQ